MKSSHMLQLAQDFRKGDKYAKYSQTDKSGEVFEILLKYSYSHMEIRKLQEISPYIRIARQEPENIEQSPVTSTVEGSDNGVEWKLLDDEEIAKGFQVYRLFDPLFILPQSKFELESVANQYNKYAEGYYNIQELHLPDGVKKF
jgi:hypothetical protein